MTKAEKAELRNEWAARILAFKASGKTVPAWCAEHNLKPHQLRYWLRKHSRTGTTEGTPAQWLPLNLKALETTPPVVVRVGHATVEVRPGFDRDLLLDVVRTLQAQC